MWYGVHARSFDTLNDGKWRVTSDAELYVDGVPTGLSTDRAGHVAVLLATELPEHVLELIKWGHVLHRGTVYLSVESITHWTHGGHGLVGMFFPIFWAISFFSSGAQRKYRWEASPDDWDYVLVPGALERIRKAQANSSPKSPGENRPSKKLSEPHSPE